MTTSRTLAHNLTQALHECESGPSKGRNPRIGRPMSDRGARFRRHGIFALFGTGGAGCCLPRDLVERGKAHFSSLEKVGLPDDLTAGHAAQRKLGAIIASNKLLHSHTEGRMWHTAPQGEIAKQAPFSHSNKRGRSDFFDDVPSAPALLPHEEGPFGFRSLWRYLHESEKGSLSCKSSVTR